MDVPEMRFYALEHAFMMLLAFVFAHLGSALPKRAADAGAKHRAAAIWFVFALLLVLAGIPWGRPLFRGF